MKKFALCWSTGRLIHCYILDISICHFRDFGSILLLLFYFLMEILLLNNVDSDQTPHNLASKLGLHCLPMPLLRVSSGLGSNYFLFFCLSRFWKGIVLESKQKIVKVVPLKRPKNMI